MRRLLCILGKELLIKSFYSMCLLWGMVLLAIILEWNGMILADEKVRLVEFFLDPTKVLLTMAIFFLIDPIGRNVIWIRQLPISRIKIILSIYTVSFIRLLAATIIPFLTLGVYQARFIEFNVSIEESLGFVATFLKFLGGHSASGPSVFDDIEATSSLMATDLFLFFLTVAAVYALGITMAPLLSAKKAKREPVTIATIMQLNYKEFFRLLQQKYIRIDFILPYALVISVMYYSLRWNEAFVPVMFLFFSFFLHIGAIESARAMLGGNPHRQKIAAYSTVASFVFVLVFAYSYSYIREIHPETLAKDRFVESLFRKQIYGVLDRGDITKASLAGVKAKDVTNLLDAYAAQTTWAYAAHRRNSSFVKKKNRVPVYLSEQEYLTALRTVTKYDEIALLLAAARSKSFSDDTIRKTLLTIRRLDREKTRKSSKDRALSSIVNDENFVVFDPTLLRELLEASQTASEQYLLLSSVQYAFKGNQMDISRFLIENFIYFNESLIKRVVRKINKVYSYTCEKLGAEEIYDYSRNGIDPSFFQPFHSCEYEIALDNAIKLRRDPFNIYLNNEYFSDRAKHVSKLKASSGLIGSDLKNSRIVNLVANSLVELNDSCEFKDLLPLIRGPFTMSVGGKLRDRRIASIPESMRKAQRIRRCFAK